MNPQRDWHSEYEHAGFTQGNEKIDIGQPDPALQQERAGAGRIAVYAVGAILVLGVVFYGLNRPAPETVAAQQGTSSATSSAPSEQPAPSQDEASKGSGNAPATTGAAPQNNKDQPQQPQANQSPQPNKPQGSAQPQKAQ
jgi:hypothetical protein